MRQKLLWSKYNSSYKKTFWFINICMYRAFQYKSTFNSSRQILIFTIVVVNGEMNTIKSRVA